MMHEFHLVKKEVERIRGKVADKKVTRAVFLLGRLAHGTPDSIREAFKVTTFDSPLSDTQLDVISVDPKLKCVTCGRIFGCDADGDGSTVFTCPSCGSTSTELIAGEECYIESIEVEE